MSAAIEEKKQTDLALPNSRRVYVSGNLPAVRVPFREIDQRPTRAFSDALEENSPVRVYDTSGPWGDPSLETDVGRVCRAFAGTGFSVAMTLKNMRVEVCSQLMMAI